MRKHRILAQRIIGGDDIAGAAVSLLPSVYKMFQGDKQEKLAENYAKTPRPAYKIPKGVLDNQSIARNLAGSRMTGEGFLRSRLDRILVNGTSGAVNAGQSSSGILNTISSLGGKEMDAAATLTNQGQKWHDTQVQGLEKQNQNVSNYEDKAWDWNSKQPYLNAMAAASALRNASMQNKYSGLSDASKALLGLTIKGFGKGTPTGTTGNVTGWNASDYNDPSGGLAVPDKVAPLDYNAA